ncbi:hypothetical protein [Leifsonia sp. TF02-11]|uniref:hypothetical protein n=1 Tax=Leifsonia sp. TF02-11 TaxID=2815212 RepID=UPI001AA0F0B5|nr:hypothetical protein [Leifsonia sp. TF02-11]MBO1741028.1 hypothetical protein [Leifsonia sp. TF02-11]
MARTGVLGGESTSRGFLGGNVGKGRLWTLAIAGVAAFIVALLFMPWGFLIGILLVAAAWVATMSTRNGSLLSRVVRRAAWRGKVKNGYDHFIPYIPEMWEEFTEAYNTAKGRRQRRAALLQLRAMRDVPDGMDGFSWLRSRRRQPGIQLHEPDGAESYLAVTFATAGQVEGLDGEPVYDYASAAAGRFAAGFGSRQSLAQRIQYVSHVQHADSALHASWLRSRLDDETVTIDGVVRSRVPRILAVSYRQLLTKYTASSPVQHRYITISWPLSPRFRARAARRGEGREGWVALMDDEIRSIQADLLAAGFKNVTALTALQTAAVFRHLQLPQYDIARIDDLSAYSGWLPSKDEWSYTTYSAELDGELAVSLARTARITAEHVETGERGVFWHDALLTRMTRPVVRTISFHIEVTSQQEARKAAAADFTSDEADRLRAVKKGELVDAATNVGQRASARRLGDLEPGTGIHGANWVGYITIHAANKTAMVDATEAIEDAAGQAGIDHLEWIDSLHATANATTWPTGRGITPTPRSTDARVRDVLAGTGPKEAL